ncbi:MAG: hypothetical protein WBG10_11480 [Pseudolabrys sp.]|jgi:hypothetical protein
MTRFVWGLFVGLFIGMTASAYAAGVFGSGTLSGWTVTKDGEEVCSDPDVDTSGKEIECD